LRQGWETAKLYRLLTSVLAAILFSCFLEPAQMPVVAAPAPPAARIRLRIGMWTLWHDHDVALTTTGPKRCSRPAIGAPWKY
jgi:hypothetical protein